MGGEEEEEEGGEGKENHLSPGRRREWRGEEGGQGWREEEGGGLRQIQVGIKIRSQIDFVQSFILHRAGR